jgi:MinD superfamily P-loop ATPase
MNLPFSVFVNRDGIGDGELENFCRTSQIDIIGKIADDRAIAEAYSAGEMIVDVLPEYKKDFAGLFENISKRLQG